MGVPDFICSYVYAARTRICTILPGKFNMIINILVTNYVACVHGEYLTSVCYACIFIKLRVRIPYAVTYPGKGVHYMLYPGDNNVT